MDKNPPCQWRGHRIPPPDDSTRRGATKPENQNYCNPRCYDMCAATREVTAVSPHNWKKPANSNKGPVQPN